MTVKVAGLWELGWSAPLTEHDLWHYPLRDFGVDEWCMCPVSGIRPVEPVLLKEYNELPEVFAANPDLTVVHVDESATDYLEDFVHPENALYVFGKVTLSSWKAYGQPEHKALKIRTIGSLGTPWPHQIAVLVLYDRMLKQLSQG